MKGWLIDISMSDFENEKYAFCEEEGHELRVERSYGKRPPSGGIIYGAFHPGGQDALVDWLEKNPVWAVRIFEMSNEDASSLIN
jgi:hypothetical protein